jgi:hypothetical protein
MIARMTGVADTGPRDTPLGAGELIRGTIGRVGVFAGLFYGPSDRQEPRLDDLFKVSTCKVRPDKLAKREVLLLEYKLHFRGVKEPGDNQEWVDRQTLLPVQRVFTMADQGKKVRVLEVYGDFAIDTKLDAKLFELPK